MGFDVTQSEQAIAREDDGIVVEILDQHDEPAIAADGSPVTITVAGAYSQRYRKTEAQMRQRIMNDRGRKLTGEQSQKRQTEFVADCCLEWHGFSDKGEALSFTRENLIDVFTRLPFVQAQVERSMGDHSFFKQKASSSSAR